MTYAILIGINSYGDRNNALYGCHNDVDNVAAFLARRPNVRVLATLREDSPPADRDAVLQAFENGVRQLGDGDELFVHFSGHGYQFFVDGDYRGAACPAGFNGSLYRAIIDKDLAEKLRDINTQARVTIVADCCFAGGLEKNWALQRSVTEDLHEVRVRTWQRAEDRMLEADEPDDRRSEFALWNLDDNGGGYDIVVLAAGGFRDHAGEYDFGHGAEGILTHFLLQKLHENPSLSLQDAVAAVNAAISTDFPNQQAEPHGRQASFTRPLIQG